MTDQVLLRRWYREQDAEAFKTVATRHARLVYGTGYRILGNAAEAEDVAQEAFLSLARAKNPPTRSAGAWLHRTATNKALDRIRSERRRRDRETRFHEQQPVNDEPVWDDIRELVDETVADLPERLRAPVLLYFFENRTHIEIGEKLGLPRQTVTYRIGRGIERVRGELRRKGIAVPGAMALSKLVQTHLVESAPATLAAEIGRIALATKPTATTLGLLGGATVLKIAAGIVCTTAIGVGAWYAADTLRNDAPEPEIVTAQTEPPNIATPPAQSPPIVAPTEPSDLTTIEASVIPAEPFKSAIQGSVSDAVSSAPLEKFQLLVKTGRFISYNPRKHRGFRTVRSPDGLYFIDEVTARGVTVFIRAEGYEPAFRYVAGLEADTATTDIDFPLTPRASLVLTRAEIPDSSTTVTRPLITTPIQYGSISGFTQDRSGYLIAGASVTVGPSNSLDPDADASLVHFRTQSDALGQFRVDNINYEGSYFVFASKTGYADTWAGTETGNAIRIRPGVVIKDVSLVLRTGTTLTGRIVNTTDRPVADARVRVISAKLGTTLTVAHHAMTYTNDDGLFTLTFEKPGWASVRIHSEEHGFGTFEKIPIQDEEVVQLKFREKARIYGKVTHADGSVATDVRIWTSCNGHSIKTPTDQHGNYSVDLQSNIAYTARVISKRGMAVIDDIGLAPLNPGENREWNVVIPVKPITIRGRVIGMPSGEPITQRIPWLNTLDYWKDGKQMKAIYFINMDGRYKEQLPSGKGRYAFQLRYMFSWSKGAIGPVTDAIQIEEGEQVELDLHVPEPLEVNIEVVDLAGDPIEGAAIIVQTDQNGSGNSNIQTNSAGQTDEPFYLPPYGGYYIEARKKGFAPARGAHHIDERPGTVLPLETLVLWPPAGIEGTIVDSDRIPWPNAKLSIQIRRDSYIIATISATTDAYGHFTLIDNVPATDLTMELQATIETETGERLTGNWFAPNIPARESDILDLGELQIELKAP